MALTFQVTTRSLICILIVISVNACSTNDAIFVTKTSIAIADVDGSTGTVSVAYDRTEGFFGPNYESGAIPPVVGSIQTDGEIWNPRIKQMYATGDAANIVVDPSKDSYTSTESDKLKGDPKPMIFGTSTTLGFKIGFAKADPSFTLGYKRKEFSYIPIRASDNESTLEYSSVIAAIDNTVSKKDNEYSLENGQFFATGETAKIIASQKHIKEIFKKRSEEALSAFDKGLENQTSIHSGIIRCAFTLEPGQWEAIIKDGSEKDLFEGLDDELKALQSEYSANPTADSQLALLKIYSEAIAGGINPESEEQLQKLKSHETTVCSTN